jgi:hypothetical protein
MCCQRRAICLHAQVRRRTRPGCIAVGKEVYYDPYSILETSGVWATPILISKVDIRLESVSCPSAGDCTAVGEIVGTSSEPIYLSEMGGIWGKTHVSRPGNHAVSC